MYSYYTTTYNGRTVHIIKAKSDTTHDVQISVVANRYDEAPLKKLASDFHDYTLEGQGYSRVGVINAGLFFTSGSNVFTNGIEKVDWDLHENDDGGLDGVMALAHYSGDSNLPIIQLQSTLKSYLNDYRGAITGAFGLIINGAVNQGNTSLLGSYGSYSGRSIIAVGWDNDIYFISVYGVSGNTSQGMTGAQCLDLVKNVLGLKDAIAMDGGGSVSLIYEGSWKVSTTREIKSVACLYVKQKSTGGGTGGGETPVFIEARDNGYMPVFKKQIPHKLYKNGHLCPIKEILVMKNGSLVPIDELRKGSS